MTVLMEGLQFTESPRWHEGRLWFSDWAAGQVIGLDPASGRHQVMARVESFPLCIDFLPDGRLLLVDSARRRLLRREPDGTLATHADLSPHGGHPWNDIVVDRRGNAYVNCIGFDFPGGEYAPGHLVLVTPDGVVRRVAGELAFPNGMAISVGGGTLIVAESYANRLTGFAIRPDGGLGERHVWATTGDHHPDGICVDTEGAVWYADVNTGRCVRLREGGEVLESVQTDRGAFACALSRSGEPRLFVVGQEYGAEAPSSPTGQVVMFPAPAAGAPTAVTRSSDVSR